ncbi:MAG TPA: hypothetical protein ENJ70_02850 [Thermoplasmatales archaeon]|nr:hypothetical protein [Thermoplasmatales archaeon]
MKWALAVAILLLMPLVPFSSGDIIVVDGGSIQDAIDRAENGDTIYVMEGLYEENIVVEKDVSIIGVGNVTMDGRGKTVAMMKSGTIKNMAFTNSSDAIVYAEHATIVNCHFYKGRYGVEANHSVIEGRVFHKCGGGALLHDGSIVINSTFFKCGLGVEVRGDGNLVYGCTAHTCGVGIYLENASHNSMERCSIYKNNNNQGDIFLLRSHHNVIEECTIGYGSFGVRTVESNHNIIISNTITGSRYGIKMEGCEGNEVRGCILEKNRFGITLENSKDICFNYNSILHARMYSIDVKHSSVDARYNWWGNILPRRMHILLSRVRIFPWLLRPAGMNTDAPMEGEQPMEKISDIVIHPYEYEVDVAGGDMDPMVNVKIKVELLRARSFGGMHEYNLSIKVDGRENESTLTGDILAPATFWQDVDDGKRYIPVEFAVDGEIKSIIYDVATGRWKGDDYLGDGDGYGHLKFGRAEIWFNIGYNDYDGDGLTYWEEVSVYHTRPDVNDRGKDYDGDGLPIEWEDKYGFDPFTADNCSVDYDGDGLNSMEEYYMEDMLSDPFARDIFIEADYMPGYRMKEESIEMLYDAFARHNITMHIEMDEEIPYMERVYYGDARNLYWDYFLHGDVNNPRHGIFHYLLLVSYGSSRRGGHVFVGFDNCDSVLLACEYINDWRLGEGRIVAYATLFMHELGHTLGIFEDTFGGVDNESCNAPWLKGWWKYANYRSCMNYRYAFQLLDYSDGSHGANDFNDWGNLKLDFFTDSYYYPSS